MTAPEQPAGPPPIPAPLLQLMSQAMHVTATMDLQAAVPIVEQIGREYPDGGVVVACLGWCDEFIRTVPGLRDTDHPVALGFLELESRTVQSPEEVPPAVRWAGRFLAARVSFDADTGQALVKSCETDEQFGQNVLALLRMCALGRTRRYIRPPNGGDR